MEKNQFKKAIQKIKKRTIQALLYISEDKYDLAMSPFFNCFKIIVFYLQLEGYIFSQYESKPLNLPENIYLANYTQLSPLTFVLLQIGDDVLTQFFFYFIFLLHCIVYLTLMKMALDSDIAKPNFIKKTLNLFFINYQWMFVTPFQEISVGVMVCGKTAFIQYNKDSPTCVDDKNKLYYIFGVLGTLFVTLSGFSISYFFRNYQFFEKTFSRQFSYANVVRIMMHQLVIVLYYINFPGIDYAKHLFQQLLGLTLLSDIIMTQPFGYSFESNFYSAATFTHQYFLVLSAVWIFSPELNDSFFFLTFLLITPLLIILSNQFQKRDQIKIVNTFELSIFNNSADKYLEEIYRTAEESDTNMESKILFIQILNHHAKLCNDSECQCQQNVQGFFSNNQIDYKQLNSWTTNVFEKCLKLSLLHKDYIFYEHMALKYVTFLAKYKNNPINAYSILQSIMNDQQSQNVQIKGRTVQTSSFYFLNIQTILQKRNRLLFQGQSVHHSLQLQLILKGHSVIENIGIQLQQQIRLLAQQKQQFWEDYYNNKIQTFQQLVDGLQKVQDQISTTQIFIKMLRSKIQIKQNGINFDCVSILNLELLFSICFTNNILEIYNIQKQIQQISLIEQQEIDSFLNYHFQNSLSICIVANITQQQRGEIWKPNQLILEKFFKLNCSITNISQLMPSFIADIHDQIIENLIRRGKSYQMEQTSLIFSVYGKNLIQPLQLTLGYFFPKFDKDFQFYLIAFFKKVEDSYKVGSIEKNNTGYLYFDINLNIIGISDVIADKLKHSSSSVVEVDKLELCYILPSVLESFIIQYKFMMQREITEFVDNDLILSKQQETFYIPKELVKVFQIEQNCCIKKRLPELEDIFDDLQKNNPFSELKQYQISFNLYSKTLSYQKGNKQAVRQLFFIKIQFLDEQDKLDNGGKDTIEKQMDNQYHTPIDSQESSPTPENGLFEIVSQRSKSSNQTILQQSNQFHNQLFNNKRTKVTMLFVLVNLIFSCFFLGTFILISFTVINKFDLSNQCVEAQSQINQEMIAYTNVINAFTNEQVSKILKLLPVNLNLDSLQLTINPKDNILLQTQLISYTVEQMTSIVQQKNLEIEYTNYTQLQFVNEVDGVRTAQNISDILILRQIVLSSAQNNNASRNIQDLSIIIINYPNYISLLHQDADECFSGFSNTLKTSTDNSTQILICIYVLLFFLFIAQLGIINKLFRDRKLILKLFTRVDYKEALVEAEKFSLISSQLRNCDNIWLSTKMTTLMHALNSKQSKEEKEEYGYRQSDKVKTVTKSEKLENADNTRLKINISHQLSNLTSFLIITGITLFTFIYIISFHVQIVQSSQSLGQYFSFRETLQDFQYQYLDSFSNCLYQVLYKTYTHMSDQKLLDLVYQQDAAKKEKLDQDLMQLNSNNFSRILITSNNSDLMNLLALDEGQQEQFFQGYFCELDQTICDLNSTRDIEYSSDLLQYFNKSIHQLLLEQGQIFNQNNAFYKLKDEQTIIQNIKEIFSSQDYFLNNIWGFDIILQRVSKSIIFLIERMKSNLEQQGNEMFLAALIIGIFYFIFTLIVLMLYSKYSKKENLIIRYYLIQVPFATIVKKNIHQQLKFID